MVMKREEHGGGNRSTFFLKKALISNIVLFNGKVTREERETGESIPMTWRSRNRAGDSGHDKPPADTETSWADLGLNCAT